MNIDSLPHPAVFSVGGSGILTHGRSHIGVAFGVWYCLLTIITHQSFTNALYTD
jgi:hypothetical protein